MKVKELIKIKKGTNRFVILVGDYAIKIPNIGNGHLLFLHGCRANYSERNYCKMMKGVENNKYYKLVAPSLFCAWFGLLQIQKRCMDISFEITEEHLVQFESIEGESKENNYGLYNGQLVCLDYGG